MIRLFACFALVLGMSGLLWGCASSDKSANEMDEKPVEQLYDDARKAFKNEEFKTAAKLFDEVERQHPYSSLATQSNIMSAYSSYEAEDYAMAVATLDRFIEMHPGNQNIAYAYYLRAICFYEQIVDVGRDQNMTQQATDALEEVMRRFPGTAYARDAKFKRDLTWDHLAGKEMEIGRFYLTRKYYQAAINRFKVVVDTYQTTTHVPEALHRMVEAYVALGVRDEAERIAAVLGYNYPGSEWYEASYVLLTTGKTKQIGNKTRTATTTAGKLKNSLLDIFD